MKRLRSPQVSDPGKVSVLTKVDENVDKKEKSDYDDNLEDIDDENNAADRCW